MIFNEDCIQGMDKLIKQGKTVDLIITDPPYLINYSSNYHKNKTHKFTTTIQNDDNPQIIKQMVERAHALLKRGGAFYCFCSYHHIDFFKQTIEKKFKVKNILVWCKNGGTLGDLEGSYNNNAEFIIFATKERHILNGKRDPAVIHINKVPVSKQVHQNQKPLKLIKYLIMKSSNKGDTVLDCFMGSGTTGVACNQLLRKFIGFEIDKTYYSIAHQRITLNR